MTVSPDGFAPASESFSPHVMRLAETHGIAEAIERLCRKSEAPKKVFPPEHGNTARRNNPGRCGWKLIRTTVDRKPLTRGTKGVP